MSEYFLYSQRIRAIIPPTSWDEAYFSLLSLKHALAGVPGWKRMDILANNQPDNTIHLDIVTNWGTVEQMEAWLASSLTVEGVLKGLIPPADDIKVAFFEKISLGGFYVSTNAQSRSQARI